MQVLFVTTVDALVDCYTPAHYTICRSTSQVN